MNYIKTHPNCQSNLFLHGFIGKEFPTLEHWNPSDQNTIKNTAKLCNDLNKPNAKLLLLDQKHTNICHIITDPNFVSGSLQADALATNNPSLILAVRTADCVPVLFFDEKQLNVAIAHAGWKGALGGVIANTLAKMKILGSRIENISIIIGPSIAQKDYEVGEEFYQAFLDQEEDNKKFFIEAANKKFFFDLPGFVKNIIIEHGIKDILLSPESTYGSKNWFSYREAFHHHQKPAGHILSFVGFK